MRAFRAVFAPFPAETPEAPDQTLDHQNESVSRHYLSGPASGLAPGGSLSGCCLAQRAASGGLVQGLGGVP